jgi:hypothetical protein
VFDSPTDEVSFAKLGRKSVLQSVKEIFADQPGRPKPIVDLPPPQAVAVAAAPGAGAVSKPAMPSAPQPGTAPLSQPEAAGPQAGTFESAAAGLIEAGLTFLESIAARGATQRLGIGGSAGEQALVPTLFARDPQTNRPTLSIPLPAAITEERLSKALAGLFSALRGGS